MRLVYLLGLMLTLLISTQSALAFSWKDWWLRPDQQGQKALASGQAPLAANLFSTPDWKGVAYYRANDYQKAYQIFAKDNSVNGYYNRGNALAHLGKYQEAINAYNQALKQNPQLADASYNKALLENLLKQQPQQSQQQRQNSDSSQNNSNNNKDSSQGSNQNNSSSQNSQQNSGQSKQSENQQNTSQNQNDQPDNSQQPSSFPQNQSNTTSQPANQQNTASSQNEASKPKTSATKQANGQASSSPADNDSSSPNKQAGNDQSSSVNQASAAAQNSQQQATEQWLQSIPDDPGGLLKQKFLRDHANYQQQEG